MKSPRKTPSRDEKYMALAFAFSFFSKDPDTQIGAYIVNSENYPLGGGYNGPPRNIDDNEVNWERPHKYDYIIHAEINAINHCKESLKDCTLYVTAKPCKVCTLYMASKGIKEIVYFDFTSDKNSSLNNTEHNEISNKIIELSGIKVRKFEGDLSWFKNDILNIKI